MPDPTNPAGPATIGVYGSALGTPLQQLLLCDAIQPGSDAGYQLAKEIYSHHPLGAKLVEMPVRMAQSQRREITIPGSPEQDVRDAFNREWDALKADESIAATQHLRKVYGASTLLLKVDEDYTDAEALPLDPWSLPKIPAIRFNVLDPLNTAGTMFSQQDPNRASFQKVGQLRVQGKPYDGSRAVVVLNGQPIYIQYSDSAYGYAGFSIYQRCLFPLKSFIQTMVTDDLVTKKAGLIVAMIKTAGSVISAIMEAAMGLKRQFLKEAQTENVISIGHEDSIQSIDLQNVDKAMITARGNVIKNIAVACPMPARIIEQESFAEGFGEGQEDTKDIVRFVEETRKEMQPLYAFMDRICQHRAWSPEFFVTMQERFPDLYAGKEYKDVFYEWQRAFKATWPSLLEEPPAKMAALEKVKAEGLLAVFQEIMKIADPENKARMVQWLVDSINELKLLFKVGIDLDLVALKAYLEEQAQHAEEDRQAANADPASGTGLGLGER